MSKETPEQRRENIRKMFDAISPRYDLLNYLLSFGRDRSWRRRAVRTLDIDSKDILLDLACGTGDVALTAHRKCDGPGEIIGVDFSEEMLKIAETKFAKQQITIPYSFVHADVTDLPLEDESVNCISIAFGIRNVVDVPKALSEMMRVLKSGGKLVILEFAPPRGRVFGPLFHWYFKKILPWIGGIISGKKSAYEYLPRSVGEFYTIERLINLMKNAGFEISKVDKYTFGVTVAYLGVKQ